MSNLVQDNENVCQHTTATTQGWIAIGLIATLGSFNFMKENKNKSWTALIYKNVSSTSGDVETDECVCFKFMNIKSKGTSNIYFFYAF